jgi:molybdenum cofactor guanylyltransferase
MAEHYPKHRVTALILAGGMGRRVAGRDKGLLIYQGKPLVSHVAAALKDQASAMFVSANRSLNTYRNLGFTPLADLRAGFPGPLAGLEAGFAACRTDYLLVSPCDTPHIPHDLGQRLWQAMRADGAQLAYAFDSERDHYLHALIPVGLAADLSAFLDDGKRAVRQWLAGKKAARARFAAGELLNINELNLLD